MKAVTIILPPGSLFATVDPFRTRSSGPSTQDIANAKPIIVVDIIISILSMGNILIISLLLISPLISAVSASQVFLPKSKLLGGDGTYHPLSSSWHRFRGGADTNYFTGVESIDIHHTHVSSSDQSVIEVEEEYEVEVTNISDVDLHADVDEKIIVRFDGTVAEILVRIEPRICKTYVQMGYSGQLVLYAELQKHYTGPYAQDYYSGKIFSHF